MPEIQVLIVEPTGTFQLAAIIRELSQFQKIVGGFIEYLPITDKVGVYFNEDGRLHGLLPNWVASQLFMKVSENRRQLAEPLYGNVIFFGISKTLNTELEQDIPQDVVDIARNAIFFMPGGRL